jgi:hypothetical protein
MQQSLQLALRPQSLALAFDWYNGVAIPVLTSKKVAHSRGVYTCPDCGTRRRITGATPDDFTAPTLGAVCTVGTTSERFAIVAPESSFALVPWTESHKSRLNVFLKHGWSQSLRRRLPADYDALLRYGITTYENLFTPRQLLVAFEYVDATRNAVGEMMRIGMSENSVNALACYLGFFLMEMVESNNRQCCWAPQMGRGLPTTFRSLAAFPGAFIEGAPHGMMDAWLDEVIPKIEAAAAVPAATKVYCGDCTNLPFGDNFFDAVVTDPPGYDYLSSSELSEFSWIWENMIQGPPASMETLQQERGHREDGPSKADDRRRDQILHSFKEICRVLKPGHRLCLFVHSFASSDFQGYLDLCNQAGLSLVEIKAVRTWIDGDSPEFHVHTCLVYLRKPYSPSVREVLQVADASVILDSVAAGRLVLYSGLAQLIVEELPEEDLVGILPIGWKGARIEQLMEVLAEEDPREVLEKCFSKRELRGIAKRLAITTGTEGGGSLVEVILSHFGFVLPSVSQRIDGATQVRHRLRLMQTKIVQAVEKVEIRGPFIEGCTAVERLLRISVWGWAQLIFGPDRDRQLLQALHREDPAKHFNLDKLSAGHIIALFRRLPDLIADSPAASLLERKFGHRHIYLPANKKTKYADRLSEIFEYRNRVEHDKDGYWTTILLADARNQLAQVLSRAEQLLLELVDVKAIPRTVEAIRETRDKWGRRTYTLSTDDGTDLEAMFSSPLTLGKSYLYFGSEVNPRPVDPFVLSTEDLGEVP